MTYPTIRPEITLDFANSRQLDPRITFSRSGDATYLNPDTGLITTARDHVARFEKEGLLIEESRTNVVQSSADYNASGWTRVSLTATANSGIAPDGTNNASLIEATANAHTTLKYFVTTSGDVTLSVYAKAGTSSRIHLFIHNDQVAYDLVGDGTVTEATSATLTGSSIKHFGNGWYRCSMTSNRADTGQNEKRLIINNSDGSYQASIGDNVLIWGMQIEENSSPSSYIPTAGQIGGVIRAVDIAQITGNNFSSWYNQSEGTMFVSMSDGVRSDLGANLYGSHSGDRIIMLASSDFRFRYQATGRYTPSWTNVNKYSANDVRAAGPMKYAYAYKPYDYALSVKGSTLTDTLRDPQPNVITLKLGQETQFGGNSRPNAAISRIAYYSRRLTDSELQTITL